jgi:hypothetical protein
VVSDLVPIGKEALTPAESQKLDDVPAELEWLANITNGKTQRALQDRRCGVYCLDRPS